MESGSIVRSKVCSLFSPFKSMSLACSMAQNLRGLGLDWKGFASKLTVKEVDGCTRRMKETSSCLTES